LDSWRREIEIDRWCELARLGYTFRDGVEQLLARSTDWRLLQRHKDMAKGIEEENKEIGDQKAVLR
jgi:hypothetical protein